MRKGFGFHDRHSPFRFDPATLFMGGVVQGALYDPSNSTTLFQDAAGTTPATAVNQAIGLMLDQQALAYSVYFDGTGDYLSSALGSPAFGTGDFTIEGWVYRLDGNIRGAFQLSVNAGGLDNTNLGLALGSNAGQVWRIYANNTGYDSTATWNTSTWYHFALVRSNGTTRLYINGTSVISQADTTNYTGTNIAIGGFYDTSYLMNGYINNVRVVSGVAVYTGNFTPPTAPLSAISGTRLLTCGTTWGSNPSVTVNGDARAIGINPFQTNVVGNHAYQTSAVSRPLWQQSSGLSYLAFDGSNDSMLTGSIDFTSTDKMTVWAGVTKLSDAAQGVVAELSATIASNNGAFLLSAPNSAAANYNWSSKGTTQVDNTVTTYTAPNTAVITGQADIAAPSNIIRVNGAQAGSVATTQGTGNFGNYPLYIGRRNNASLPFNGRLYGLIVLGAAASDWQVFAAEQYMAQKTGISII